MFAEEMDDAVKSDASGGPADGTCKGGTGIFIAGVEVDKVGRGGDGRGEGWIAMRGVRRGYSRTLRGEGWRAMRGVRRG